ncbi:MAG: sigma-70 family RNA polymerase sigma factor [Clostridia bacterium]|nr:sigma-70 family RNA polymerase sigma factor [Clostridia bacterium]
MEDREIIKLYWERNERAIAETSEKYGRYCYAIAWNILHRREDAEECENDTYLAAWKAMPPKCPSRLSVFLGKITRNIALDYYDYHMAQKRSGTVVELLSEFSECVADTRLTEHALEAKETAAGISRFLRQQNSLNRMIFVRRYWYADSIADIADRFKISQSKVKTSLFRTRKKLREYLETEDVLL